MGGTLRVRHLDISKMESKILFRVEGRRIVLFRGLIALLFMALILSFAFSSLIIDPVQEANELPVKTSMFAKDPTLWMSQDVYVVVVRIFLSFILSVDHPSLGTPHISKIRVGLNKFFFHCRCGRHGDW